VGDAVASGGGATGAGWPGGASGPGGTTGAAPVRAAGRSTSLRRSADPTDGGDGTSLSLGRFAQPAGISITAETQRIAAHPSLFRYVMACLPLL
jgi:hypothetical protein